MTQIIAALVCLMVGACVGAALVLEHSKDRFVDGSVAGAKAAMIQQERETGYFYPQWHPDTQTLELSIPSDVKALNLCVKWAATEPCVPSIRLFTSNYADYEPLPTPVRKSK